MAFKTFALLSSLVTIGSAQGKFNLATIKHIFSFGDSYTDTGFSPSGQLAGPTIANPLGNPAFPGVTSSGGENWVGFLIDTFNQTRTFSYNFAFSGATLDSSLAAPSSSNVVSVRNQIEQEFIPGLGQKPASVPWTSEDSLFVIFDGINDVLNIDGENPLLGIDKFVMTDFWLAFAGNPDQTTAQAPFFTLYQTLVNELFNVGARNFLFVGVPAIDLTPFVQEQGPNNPAEAKASLELWNQNVQAVASELKSTQSGVTTFFADMETLFRSIVADPESVGISNAADLWFNTLHPVPAVHKAMAQLVASTLG